MLQDSEDEQRVLGGEDSQEQGAGQGGAATAGGDGVALHHGMGVRAEAEEAGGDAGGYRLHAEPHLATGPWCAEGGGISADGRGERINADGSGGDNEDLRVKR